MSAPSIAPRMTTTRLEVVVSLDVHARPDQTDKQAREQMRQHLATHLATQFREDFGASVKDIWAAMDSGEPVRADGYDGPFVTCARIRKLDTQTQRLTALGKALGTAADLIGNDPATVHPEYIRAMVEFVGQSHGVPSDSRESLTLVLIALGATESPESVAAAFASHLGRAVHQSREAGASADTARVCASMMCDALGLRRTAVSSVADLIEAMARED